MSTHHVGIDAAEYAALLAQVKRTIWEVLDPLEEQIESQEKLPYDVIYPALRTCGAFGLLIPREFGGRGLSVRQYLPIIAEFAKIHGGIRVLVHVHNSFAHALSEVATPEQCAGVLAKAATGEGSVAFALTEPGPGTGAALGSTAEADGDGYVLRGEKWLITNSDVASHFIVLAKTEPDEVSAFLVPRDSDGLSIEALPETMGCKGGEHGRLTFDGVRVDAAALLGERGQGQEILERALEVSRVFIAASSLGTAQRSFELSLEHAKSRVTFGKPLASRQAIQRYLAEMAIDIAALRHLLADAAAKWDAGRRIPAEASMVKQFGLEAVGRVTDRALLVHGGIGYTRAHPIERLYRDARLNWLEEGTPTIQYMVTARAMLDGYSFDDAFDVDSAEQLPVS